MDLDTPKAFCTSLSQTIPSPSCEDFPFVEVSSPTNVAVQTLQMAATTRRHNILPTPVVFAEWLRKTAWLLRSDWQSASEIYRVLNDLHTHQRFTDLVLIYLLKTKLTVICGRESVASGGDIGASNADAMVVDGQEAQSVVHVIPGSFTSGILTGLMRIQLDEELQVIDGALETLFGVRPDSGWTLAVTDCDQVCYYVERMLTFSQLMPSDAKSREEELCEFFGRRRAINDRSLKSRKLHKERKERLVKERLQRAVESELKDSQTGTLGDLPEVDDAPLDASWETMGEGELAEENDSVENSTGAFQEFDQYDALDP